MVYTKRSGFSLVEIMIALFIISIMAGGVMYMVPGYLRRARTSRAKTEIKIIDTGITTYQVDIGQFPQTLKDLVRRPSDERAARKWQKGGYLQGKKERPIDPWGNKYKYKVTPGQERQYELFSYGPDGKGGPKHERISVWD